MSLEMCIPRLRVRFWRKRCVCAYACVKHMHMSVFWKYVQSNKVQCVFVRKLLLKGVAVPIACWNDPYKD